mgnify:CR=1 FL=1
MNYYERIQNSIDFIEDNLAEEITVMIHSREEYEKAVAASGILFGAGAGEALKTIDEQTFLQVFEGVPQYKVAASELSEGVDFLSLCVEKAPVFPSKGELRKLIQGGGISLNKEKIADPYLTVTTEQLIAGKYLLVQKGKKNNYIIIAE